MKHKAPASPPSAFDQFYRTGGGQTPANAVRLAWDDFLANAQHIPDVPRAFGAQLNRAARILDAFEQHRFLLDRMLQDSSDTGAAEARQAFITAVR